MALFARRERPGLARRARWLVAPPGGMARAMRYLMARVKRLRASPHAVAAGFASGAAASCLPLIGFHFLVSFALAFVVRGSFVAAALGTAVGNPLTFPLLYATAFRLGRWILEGGGTAVPAKDAAAAGEELALAADAFDVEGTLGLWPIWRTTFIGSLPIALLAWVGFYCAIRPAVARFQARRRAVAGAGSGNRTRTKSLEGSCDTVSPCPPQVR